MLSISHLAKRLGRTQAINGLDLEIGEGEVFGLLGPNGAGKTTLIRLVLGLLTPDAGSIRLFGGDAAGSIAARSRIGYMPQQLSVYPGLTVRENVLFFGRMYHMEERDLSKRTDEVVRMVELEDRADDKVSSLSGGMVRRTMLATALVHRPRLLLLDEPTAGVDPLLRLRFWEWFGKMVSDGTSIIVTTHTISEATHCHNVVFLRNGEKLEQGTPAQLMSAYGCGDLESAFAAATRSRGAADGQELAC